MGKSPYAQDGYRFRFDWGLSGAREIAEAGWVVAVVDVLSFTTTLTVAVDACVEVFPYRWRDESAVEFANEHDAVLAVGRSQPGKVSLSPGTVRNADGLRRLVLPSPNGATISHAMQGHTVIGVSLRNATAAAAWTAERLRSGEAEGVAVVAAGEHWRESGTLRPGAEDLWGAGAYLAALDTYALGMPSPEARLAAAAYRDVASDLTPQLRACASGQELIGLGFGEDVEIAAEFDSSTSVPVLVGPRFRQSR
ncbi:2-phosphosulfolactate phosphatase [Actinokineospora terrae]|uniref:Probable 2-phosphosulfolactate phosphatase n=1 Tax=Actinokineospora terrae TaxID=155974 RepID=A0A1H9P0L5_9PSEU|nr:2-phosphosulfolactate phosphatase [Actinokineospora terrae]SER41369.1 2-phosphosulfolactate phosphatase [Actinokineospora terrae]